MAAGPVGIAGGVFGGRTLLIVGSDFFAATADGVEGATGFKFCSLCEKFLLSGPLPAIDSQLSIRAEVVVGTACAVDIKLMAERIGRSCISGFARRSDPWIFESL